MAVIKLYNLARMTTATSGTGTITLGSAATVGGVLYLSFAAAGVSDAEVVMYGIADTSNSEVGYGTYTSAGTTLTRNVLRSTNSNNAISLSGSAQVFITGLAENIMLGAMQPQGRLTLTSATPVLTTTVSGATTVYYALYQGNMCPIYNGAFFVNTPFTELSQATTDNTKSPAAATTNSNYDMFVWNDAGTIRCTRGPAWTSDTGRGTGAGTTELVLTNGIYLNNVAITNGPGASRGTYVGTIRTNGSSQVDYIFGAVAAGGTAASFGLWNCYNRVRVGTFIGDTADSWTYGTTTIRPANNSSTFRASFVRGLNEDACQAEYGTLINSAAAGAGAIYIGLDSTTAFSGRSAFMASGSGNSYAVAQYDALPGLGFHYLQALEYAGAANATFYGDNGNSAVYQMGMNVSLWL